MGKKDSPDQKLLYAGTSLEQYLAVKQKLDVNGIAYTEQTRQKEKFPQFLYRLFAIGVGSLGTAQERELRYTIYVKEADFEIRLPQSHWL